MVDIHSHILPYVDDGANRLSTAIGMLKDASLADTDSIVLTPHCNLYENEKNLLEEMQAVFNAFKGKIENENIDIDVYLGAEVFCNDGVIPLAKNHLIPTLNGSRFMLIEFDFGASSRYICDMIKNLTLLGYVPIVAHPERYDCVTNRISSALDFMNCGALLQVNKGSILGEFGIGAKNCAFELINHRLAQFVASDAHGQHSRNTNMELAFDIVREDFGDRTAQKLFDINPRAVINNSTLKIGRPVL